MKQKAPPEWEGLRYAEHFGLRVLLHGFTVRQAAHSVARCQPHAEAGVDVRQEVRAASVVSNSSWGGSRRPRVRHPGLHHRRVVLPVHRGWIRRLWAAAITAGYKHESADKVGQPVHPAHSWNSGWAPYTSAAPGASLIAAPGSVVFDFNSRQPWPSLAGDVAVMSGVVEYIRDVGRFLAAVAEVAPRGVVSYSVADSLPVVGERRGHGWVNDYTEAEFMELLDGAGWAVMETGDWWIQRLFWITRLGS